eukprot:TRINITY_DN776113_c0_g1_i1.p1 TRINITY_DN776113_c0_g1~~TRINITY_DN776113_c0_g1_i1.p1  ORF type:complete len:280 (-),score=84.26 TRINITY_DN776113_c0_g1_i1:147-986(-)
MSEIDFSTVENDHKNLMSNFDLFMNSNPAEIDTSLNFKIEEDEEMPQPMGRAPVPTKRSHAPIVPSDSDDDDDIMGEHVALQEKIYTETIETYKVELEKKDTRIQELEMQNSEMKENHKTLRKENENLSKQVNQLDKKLSRAEKFVDISKKDSTELKTKVRQLTREVSEAQILGKRAEKGTSDQSSRIIRLTEENERLKKLLRNAKLEHQSIKTESNKETEALKDRVRLLESNQKDLIVGMKKQIKLIDILKRQKIHLEMAKLLSFTEEEFMKAIEGSA